MNTCPSSRSRTPCRDDQPSHHSHARRARAGPGPSRTRHHRRQSQTCRPRRRARRGRALQRRDRFRPLHRPAIVGAPSHGIRCAARDDEHRHPCLEHSGAHPVSTVTPLYPLLLIYDKEETMNSSRAPLGLALLAGAALLAAGAAHAADPAPAKSTDNPVVATVNGTALTTRDLAAFSRTLAPQGQTLGREDALQALVDRELMYQDKVATKNVKEFKARHILVPTEAEAKDVIAQLDKGANFSDLAKAKSKDRASAESGGDLGWFSAGQMVPQFSQAGTTLDKGKYTKTPVRTQFGYHVVVLDDTRKVDPPSFDSIKDRLAEVVQSQKIGEYLETLRKKAKIDVKAAPGAPAK